ncbi:hypothetical protein Bpfe_021084, partial [Biomphalaria pfeifferi]
MNQKKTTDGGERTERKKFPQRCETVTHRAVPGPRQSFHVLSLPPELIFTVGNQTVFSGRRTKGRRRKEASYEYGVALAKASGPVNDATATL